MTIDRLYYGKQFVDFKDKIALKESLNQKLISGGQLINNFESRLSKYLNSKYSIVCSSGTAALHLIFLSLNLKKKDTVILPAINFAASANILRNLKINFFLADVDINTGQISSESIINCIKKNKIKNLKAVVTSYLGGHVHDIENIVKLKKKIFFFLIEDSCHAFGSKYLYKNFIYKVGSSKHSDISSFSFHPVKSITTGEGGLITTSNKNIAQKIRLLRSHGIERSKNYWNYDIKNNGLNYRLSDINAALGISQLNKIQEILKKRKAIAKIYTTKLKQSKILQKPFFDINSSWHLYIIKINFSELKICRDSFIKHLIKKKIYPQIHYIPTYHFSSFRNFKKKDFPFSEIFYSKCLSLPIYASLKKNEVLYIIKNIENLINKYKK
jgi:dTDP-4-amino-4,6-dideoxygalactose transaminase